MSKNAYVMTDRLLQIAESIQLIQEWSKDIHAPMDFLAPMQNRIIFDACVMRLQVIGENVGKLLHEEGDPLAAYAGIPWLAIYDLRNIISHEYANIDEAVIYYIIQDDLPPLKQVISEMLGANESEEFKVKSEEF